ncbi:MAG: hypothetical protein M3552_02220 [Planctomycetota bacterium]|nr:hypothetical protein [Planctomycetaceae bacterium]MDQ3329463.1 hypothetical protein [Planctomycetota bacterium]
MHRSAARITFALVAVVFCLQNALRASDAVPAAAAGVSETPKPPRLLVLHNGDLVEGSVVLAQGGYQLIQPSGGRILLPEPVVWFTAASRDEAYQELRKRFPDKSANGHVALARWCNRYGLAAAAEDELRTALTIDPQHREARNSLRLIAEPSNPVPSFVTNTTAEYDSASTLGGLPPKIALEFVNGVQPILVNGCGNASCHGTTSKSAFTIQNARSGNAAFKALTQRNLETVRERIDLNDPAHSLIFTAPQTPGHGGSRRSIFAGPSGRTQLRTLLAWADAVAKATRADQKIASKKPAALVLTSGTQSTGDVPHEADADAHDEIPRGIKPSSKPDAVTDVLKSAIAEERPDAFDPHEFNRRFGPDAGRSSLPASEGPQR